MKISKQQRLMIWRLLECDFFYSDPVALKKYIFNAIENDHMEISEEHISESEETQTIYLRDEPFEYKELEHMEQDKKMIFYIFNLEY